MKKLSSILVCILVLFVIGLWYADATSPYGRFTVVKPFFSATIAKNGQIELHQINPISFVKNPFIDFITYPQRMFRTLSNARFSEKPFTGNEEQIIQQIHTQRYDISKPYVISGAHFAEFYVRNFGIFYSAMLDPRFGISQSDWELRQRVTVQTLATHLALLRESGREYTTFIPIWSTTFTGVNWATDPSDSLFAVYYTMSAMINDKFIANNFPAPVTPIYQLQTQTVGKSLLKGYSSVLSKVTDNYLDYIIDPSTGLIKTTITLSSARDGIKRQSSFYDNVVAWSTAKMASDLGVSVTCPVILRKDNACDFVTWKQKIITAFWDDKTGIFLDDLSLESRKNHIFSGDAFIVTSTRFLDFTNPQDKNMIEREIAYVQANKLDQPFPLRYAIHDQPDRLYFFVRYFAPSYMGETIWSHWGMEYLKTLLLLAKDKPQYTDAAMRGLSAYTQNIEKFGGYPELYDKYGNIYTTPFYKSILHTGWVINYEQTKMMLSSKSLKM